MTTNTQDHLTTIEASMRPCVCGAPGWLRIQETNGQYAYAAYCSKRHLTTDYHSTPEMAAKEWENIQAGLPSGPGAP